MRFVISVFNVVIGVLVGVGLTLLVGINFDVLVENDAAAQMSYTDLAAINMTAATVALGSVALVVTIAAVFGFQVIRSASVTAAEKRVKEDLTRHVQLELSRMEKDGRLADTLERAIYSGGVTGANIERDEDIE